MWNETRILAYIEENLSESRFIHVMGVKKTAEQLAQIYGVDMSKARLAAIIHDCAKNMGNAELIATVKNMGYKIDSISKKNPQLLHGLAGAILAETKMNIKDGEVIDAVRYHTTGRKNMSNLEKIIYIADYIEPSRTFLGVERYRKIAYENLNVALQMILENSIKYILDRGELLHLDTIHARNSILLSNKNRQF